MLGRIARLGAVYSVEGVLALLMLALCVDVLAAVFFRYVLHMSLGFYDELARYLFIWVSFLGAAVGVKRHGHFAIHLVVGRLSGPLRHVFNVLSTLGMLVLAGLLVSSGLTMVRLTSRELSPAMEVSVAYLYAIVPISGALMILYLLPHLIRQLRGRA